VAAGGKRGGRAALALARRRAEAALRLLEQLGASRHRIHVAVDPDGEIAAQDRDLDRGPSAPPGAVSMEVAAQVSGMVPREEAERQRIEAERRGAVVC
jgi:hypothetical protein